MFAVPIFFGSFLGPKNVASKNEELRIEGETGNGGRQIGQKGVSATGNFPNSRDSIKPPLLMETARVTLPKKLNSPDSEQCTRTDFCYLSSIISAIIQYYFCYFESDFLNASCNIFSIIGCEFSCLASQPVCILHTANAWGEENTKTGL